MESQSSSPLLLKYLINDPLASKLRFPKPHLAMGPLVLPHNHIKVSIDFPFSGRTSDNSDQKTIYEGIEVETCWILITYHFTVMNPGYARIYKTFPIARLSYLLNHYYPTYNDKYIQLD